MLCCLKEENEPEKDLKKEKKTKKVKEWKQSGKVCNRQPWHPVSSAWCGSTPFVVFGFSFVFFFFDKTFC